MLPSSLDTEQEAGHERETSPPSGVVGSLGLGVSSTTGDRRSGLERIRTPPPVCKTGVLPLHHEPDRPAKESNLLGPFGPTRYPPTIAAWRLAVRPAGHRKESSRCPP